MSDRETKRPRIIAARSGCRRHNDSDSSDTASLPHLTPDIWATVMPFLPYRDNLKCTAVNRSFLRDVAPRVKWITVLSAAEMKARPARRFSGVEFVTVGCLIRNGRTMHGGDRYGEFDEVEDPLLGYEVDGEVVNLLTPFLCLFPSLKLARAGGYLDFMFVTSGIGFVMYDAIDRICTEVLRRTTPPCEPSRWPFAARSSSASCPRASRSVVAAAFRAAIRADPTTTTSRMSTAITAPNASRVIPSNVRCGCYLASAEGTQPGLRSFSPVRKRWITLQIPRNS